jgi:protein phosphatase
MSRVSRTADTTAPGTSETAGEPRLRCRAAMLSHTGCVRPANEDYVLYTIPDDAAPDAALGMLAIVADGMGGHAAGEVASEMAAKCIHYLYYRKPQPVPEALAEGLAAANHAIHQFAQSHPECADMGTTCTVVAVRNNCIWLGHVGDSRAYLVRNDKLYRISEDDSLVAALVRQGTLTEGEAKNFPDRNVILRALGIKPKVESMVWREGLPAKAGDVLVLCSDGLSDVVDDDAIRSVASSTATGVLAPFAACQSLLQTALDAKAPDNVSVGVIAIGPAARDKVGRTTQETVASQQGAT